MPKPGGRRDTRQRVQARSRTTQVVAGGIAIGAFAVGSFASVGANALAAPSTSVAAQTVTEDTVAPVDAAALDLQVVTETEEVAIDHGSVEEADYGAFKGSKTVVTEGEDGTALVSYEVTIKDGKEVGREEAMRVVVEEPVDEVVSVGALTVPTASNSGANRALGKSIAASSYGWGEDQWQCLNALWTKESGWRHTAHNRSSGAYGIPQSLPGSKMASVGADWRTNPATQIKWGLRYIKGRYGTPCGAWGHSVERGWY